MEQAKSVIASFMGKSGKHDTTVDESVNPAVTQEEVKPQRLEEQTTAIDREVHQDHHHTTIQPLQHQEVLPEQHTHQAAPVEERVFSHDNEDETKQRLAAEAAQFQDTSMTHPTRETTANAPTVTGEHVHHHVHENVQPVVHKETIQPEVVHTTVPIHEKHMAPSEHHGMSVLPAKNLTEFQGSGGSLTGQSQTHHGTYEGHPRPYNPEFQRELQDVDKNPLKHDGVHDLESTGHSSNTRVGAATAAGAAGIGMMDRKSAFDNNDPAGTRSTETTGGIGNNTAASTGTFANDQVSAQGTTGTTGTGLRGTRNDLDNTTDTTGVGAGGISSGPHRTDFANQADPNVDSRTGATGMGAGNTLDTDRGVNQGNTADQSTARALQAAHDVSHRDMEGNLVAGKGTGATSGITGDTVTGAPVDAADDSTMDKTRDIHNTRATDNTGVVGNPGTTDNTRMNDNTEALDTAGAPGDRETIGNTGATNNTGATDATATTDSTRDKTTSQPTDSTTDQQSGVQGKDPAVEGPTGGDHPKMTGTGAPGSHSAYFGLTPDGKRDTNTSSTTTAPAPVGQKASKTDDEDDGSRRPEGAGVKDQLNDPTVAQKGHEGSAVETDAGGAGDKPGTGTAMSNPSQGTGDVRPGENSTDTANA